MKPNTHSPRMRANVRGRGRQSSSQQPARRDQLRQRPAENQEKLKKQLLKMIKLTLLPSEITEDINFVRVLNPDFYVPPKPEMRSLFLSVYTEKEKKLQSILASADDIVLTCELWSAKAEDYLTVGGHFVDVNGELRSYVLKTVRLFGNNSAANIQNQLSAVMKEWNMTEKVHSVVKAGVPQLENDKFIQMPCFADILNGVFKHLMTDDELSNDLKKCRDILEFFNSDAEAERRLRKDQHRLQENQGELTVDYGDRWLPSLQMLQRLTEQYRCMRLVLHSRRIDLLLNQDDEERIKRMMLALEPLNKATSSMKQQGFQSISAMLPLLISLMDELQEKARSNEVARKLLSKCQTKFGDVNNHKLAVNTFLDPRFKDQLGQQNKKEARAKIQKELVAGEASSSAAAAKVERLLDRYDAYRPAAQISNPLAWWRLTGKEMFGDLSRFALKKLGVVSTAVPLERAFSSTADRFQYLRSSIKPEDLHVDLFLHENRSSKL